MMHCRPGDVLYLPQPRDAIPRGEYAVLTVVDGSALLCQLERSWLAGRVRMTDHLFTVGECRLAATFRPTDFRVPLSRRT